jgi:hypothetical protein
VLSLKHQKKIRLKWDFPVFKIKISFWVKKDLKNIKMTPKVIESLKNRKKLPILGLKQSEGWSKSQFFL